MIKTKGWAAGPSVLSLPVGADGEDNHAVDTTGYSWQLLESSFTSLPLQHLSPATFSESCFYELLWLIPAKTGEFSDEVGS